MKSKIVMAAPRQFTEADMQQRWRNENLQLFNKEENGELKGVILQFAI